MSSKKPYQKPKLTAYGRLQDLTTGGTRTSSEGGSGKKPKP